MVGIVIVSHSSKIAQGVVELSQQMAQGDVKILSAGGTEDGSIGTDATKIMEAIIEADSGNGVLVMVDLGSAIMSTEMAIDLIDEKKRDMIKIADAPIVEGSISAVVQASIGETLDKVKSAAEESKDFSKM